MRKSGLCCRPVSVRPSASLSVCLSVCHVGGLYPDGWRYRQTSRLGSPIILVFYPRAPVSNSKRNPFSGDAKYKGWDNFEILVWNRRLSRKRYDIVPWLLWNVNRKSYALYRMVTFSMTLTDPDRFSRSRHVWSRISQKRCVLGTKLL